MKKSFLFAGLAVVASLFMMSCENAGGSSSGKSSAKLWPAYDQNAKNWGYVNADGSWAFEARFDGAREFSEGYALVKAGSGWEFINATGNRVQGAPQFDECNGKFVNGFMRFRQGQYWGLMNNQLAVEIDPYCADLGDMSDIGLISYKRSSNDYYSYVDKKKNEMIEPLFIRAEQFIDGFAVVEREGGSITLINKSGNVIIQNKGRLESLGNGRISYYDTQRGKYGMLTTQKQEKGNPVYSHIYKFTDNGLARVYIDNKYSYIDKDATEKQPSNGRAVDATDFHEGIAFVKYVETGDFEAIGPDGVRKFALNKGEVPYNYFNGGLCLVWSLNDRDQYSFRYINANGTTVREWVADSRNGGIPEEEPVMTPGVTPSDPIGPIDPVDPIDPIDPSQGGMYIKHPWNGTDWTWQPMSSFTEEGTTIYYYDGVWNGIGFNVNSTQSDSGPDYHWFPASEIAENMNNMSESDLNSYIGYRMRFMYYEYYGEQIAFLMEIQ